MTNNISQADYDKLCVTLFDAQETLHTFSDSAQTSASRKAAKYRFVEATLALDAEQDRAKLWEIADVLADRDNAQNTVKGTNFEFSTGQLEAFGNTEGVLAEKFNQLQADLTGKPAVSAVSESLYAEYEKALDAEQDRVTDFLSKAFENQIALFIENEAEDGSRVLGPLSQYINDYSTFAEWLILRTLIHAYSFLHYRTADSVGYFPRFDRAKGYIVVTYPEETAAAAYALASGRAKKAEAAGEADSVKYHTAQAQTFKSVIDRGKDLVPGEAKLFPAPVWCEKAVTLETILTEMYPDTAIPDKATVKKAYWLLNERTTADNFIQWAYALVPELKGLVGLVATTYCDLVRAARAGAGLEPETDRALAFDAGRPNRTIKIETLRQRILNTAAVTASTADVAAGFGKRKAAIVVLLRENGVTESKRGPKKGRKAA